MILITLKLVMDSDTEKQIKQDGDIIQEDDELIFDPYNPNNLVMKLF